MSERLKTRSTFKKGLTFVILVIYCVCFFIFLFQFQHYSWIMLDGHQLCVLVRNQEFNNFIMCFFIIKVMGLFRVIRYVIIETDDSINENASAGKRCLFLVNSGQKWILCALFFIVSVIYYANRKKKTLQLPCRIFPCL